MTDTFNRRTLLQIAGAAGAVIAMPAVPRAQNSPIRIGFIAPLSGSQQLVGAPLRVGAEVARDQINAAGGIKGRMIELVVRDDKGDPTQSVAAVRELVSGGVNLIAGVPLTATAMAVAGIIQSIDGVYFATGSGEDKLTHELFNRNFFTAAENNYTRLQAYGAFMAKRYPDISVWTAVFPDITVGHSAWARMRTGLTAAYKALGKEVRFVDPVLTKFGATDFKNQIAALMASGADACHSVLFGGDAVTFFQQAVQLGLLKKLTVMSEMSLDVELPRALKKSTPDNVWSSTFWYPGAFPGNAESDALLKAYAERAGNPYPPSITSLAHTAVRAYGEALKATGGASDTSSIIAALEAGKLQTVRGPAVIRKEDHQILTSSSYIRAVPNASEQGWEIKDAIAIDLTPFANPATPGIPLPG